MKSLYRILKYKLAEQWRELSPGVKRTLVASAIVLVHLFIYQTSLGEAAESYARQFWYRLRGPRPVPNSVTYVRLDSETLRTINLPSDGMIPRWAFADAISKITAAGAKMIVLDFFFFAEGQDKESDRRLAEALDASPSVIGRSVVTRLESDPAGRQTLRREQKRPLPEFAAGAKAVIPLQVQTSAGRMVERITVPEELLDPGDAPTPLLRPLRTLVQSSAEQPGPDDLVNYYGEPAWLTNLSLAELLRKDRRPADDYFRDRVVLIGGATHAAPGVPGKDSFRVPSSSTEMYGVEIHATIVANLLDRTWLRKASPQIEQLLLNLTGLATLGLALLVRPAPSLVLSACMSLAWGVIAYTAFSRLSLSLPGALWFGFFMPLFAFARWAIARRTETPF